MRPQAILISVLVILTGCAEVPLGPSVAVMPAPGKPFDLFVSEESICRHYAEQQVGISPQQATQNSTATGAVAGTALGAAAGGAIGAAFGAPGPGAAVGAGTSLLGGREKKSPEPHSGSILGEQLNPEQESEQKYKA